MFVEPLYTDNLFFTKKNYKINAVDDDDIAVFQHVLSL
jgi:hypothetical protein